MYLFKKILTFIYSLLLLGISINCAAATHADHFNVLAYGLGSYNYLQHSNKFTSGNFNRGNKNAENGVRINQLYLAFQDTPDQGLGGFTNIVLGETAIAIAPDGWNPKVFNLQNVGLTVPEAYLTYRTKAVTLYAGEMLTLAGIESFVFTGDTNFTQSIVDGYAQPGAHLGLKASFRLIDHFNFIFGVGNGWNTIRQPGRFNMLEAGIDYQYRDILSMMLNIYNGEERLTDGLYTGPTAKRTLIDFYGHYQLTQQWQLAWNLDYGTQNRAALPFARIGSAVWRGVDAYLNYQYNADWRTSLRGEVFDDSDGYRTGVRQVWKELTLTVGYEPIKHLELLAEVRHDISNQAAFVGKGGDGVHHNQQSFSLAAFYRIA